MAPSILAGQDRLPLNNGMELRLLSALEVLQARREAGELAQEMPAEKKPTTREKKPKAVKA